MHSAVARLRPCSRAAAPHSCRSARRVGGYESVGCGTVFSITTSGQETALHSFAGRPDGALPLAALVDVKGVLYGTTLLGGAYGYGSEGGGTVYSITPAGAEKVLYPFKGGADASFPESSLIDVNGILYGTTYEGGDLGCGDCGTVYRVGTTGDEKVLHRFGGWQDGDGAYPQAGLTDVNGVLYGTTTGEPSADATVYSVTLSGADFTLTP